MRICLTPFATTPGIWSGRCFWCWTGRWNGMVSAIRSAAFPSWTAAARSQSAAADAVGRHVDTCEATVSHVSDLLSETEERHRKHRFGECAPRWTGTGTASFGSLGGRAGGSIYKQEKGTVLRHRSDSQRRATPAAFCEEFRVKPENSKQTGSIPIGAGFEA